MKFPFFNFKSSLLNEYWATHIIKQWKREGIKLNPGTTIGKISQAEEILNFVFPEDFKQLYLKVNGFKDWDWRANMFTIWPIDNIIEEYRESRDKNFIGFSDYCINIHQLGFVRNKGGIYKHYDQPEYITGTFEEAIILINSDSELIY